MEKTSVFSGCTLVLRYHLDPLELREKHLHKVDFLQVVAVFGLHNVLGHALEVGDHGQGGVDELSEAVDLDVVLMLGDELEGGLVLDDQVFEGTALEELVEALWAVEKIFHLFALPEIGQADDFFEEVGEVLGAVGDDVGLEVADVFLLRKGRDEAGGPVAVEGLLEEREIVVAAVDGKLLVVAGDLDHVEGVVDEGLLINLGVLYFYIILHI